MLILNFFWLLKFRVIGIVVANLIALIYLVLNWFFVEYWVDGAYSYKGIIFILWVKDIQAYWVFSLQRCHNSKNSPSILGGKKFYISAHCFRQLLWAAQSHSNAVIDNILHKLLISQFSESLEKIFLSLLFNGLARVLHIGNEVLQIIVLNLQVQSYSDWSILNIVLHRVLKHIKKNKLVNFPVCDVFRLLVDQITFLNLHLQLLFLDLVIKSLDNKIDLGLWVRVKLIKLQLVVFVLLQFNLILAVHIQNLGRVLNVQNQNIAFFLKLQCVFDLLFDELLIWLN